MRVTLKPSGTLPEVVGWANRTGSGIGFLALFVAALYPVLINTGGLVFKFIPIAFYSIVAVGLNFTLGSAGEFSLGQAGVFAAGAYGSGLLTSYYHWNFWPALPVAVLVAMVVSLLIGTPGLRLGGWYFALTTLLAASAVTEVAEVWPHAGGATGVSTIPALSIAGSTLTYTEEYLLLLASLFLLMLLLANFMRSRWGLAFVSMRQSNRAAESTGIAVLRMKLLAYLVAGIFAGYAGAFLSAIDGYISPNGFPFSLSILFIAGVTIGGMGSMTGPIIGIAVLQILPNVFSGFTRYALLIYGAVLVAVMVFIPHGVIPAVRSVWVALVVRLSRAKGWVHGPAERAALVSNDPMGPSAAAEPQLGASDEAASFEEAAAAAATTSRTKVESAGSLVVQVVSKRFGGNQALDGASLEAMPGEVTAVIGPNGSGKTTLLNMVLGFYAADSGSISLGAIALLGKAPYRVSRAGVARTFQTPVVIKGRTACENVMSAMFPRRAVSVPEILVRAPRARRDWRECRRQALELLELVGLAAEADVDAASLTAGQQRLLEIARALATQPKAILLDEPAAGLVGQEVTALATLLRGLRDDGYIVVLVEHNVNLVMSVADHVIVFDQGRVIADGDVATVQRDPKVLEVYLGEADHA